MREALLAVLPSVFIKLFIFDTIFKKCYILKKADKLFFWGFIFLPR